MKKKTKTLILILTTLTLIVGGSIGGLFLLNKENINIFDYIKVTGTGISDKAELDITHDPINISKTYTTKETQDRMSAIVKELNFDADKRTNLSNNDTIQISINTEENKSTLNKYKIKLTQTESAYTISGLAEVPDTWNDVKDQESITNLINLQIEDKKEVIFMALDAIATKSLGKSLDLEITESLQSIYYQKETDKCYLGRKHLSNYICGTVVFVYKYETTVQNSNYYFTKDPTMYHVHVVTNIYQGDYLDTFPEKLIRDEDDWTSKMHNLTDVESHLESIGFQKM